MAVSPAPATTKANMEKDQVNVTSSTAKSKKWSLKKKLALGGVIALVVIGLAVGLGVGLTVGRSGSGSDDNDSDNSNEDDGDNTVRKETWRPKVGSPWQITLIKPLDMKKDLIPNVDIYDLDLFDNKKSTFDALHKQGKKVICYFSAGSYEDWRDDAKDFKKSDLGKPLDGWPGERWIKLSSTNVRNIMKKRIKYAADKGCDAIDPDNVDGFQNENGLNLKASDSISFMKFLAKEARRHKMSIGLKNAGDIIQDVLPDMDFSVNEQCIEYSECETFAAFVEDDKPVFNIEYPTRKSAYREICSKKGKAKGTNGFSIVIKDMDLDRKVEYCNGKKYS